MSEEIAAKCRLLEEMVKEFEGRTRAFQMSRYEADDEALNLMQLACRNVTGVITLARTSLKLLPPAEVAARAAYEASVKAAWMLAPADPYDREARWTTHLSGEVDFLDKQIREGTDLGIDMTRARERRDVLDQFGNDVAQLLRQKGYATKGRSPIPQMLIDIGERRTYGLYSQLCETAHGGHSATWIFRSGGVGSKKVRGEFITDSKWDLPLAIARFVFKCPVLLLYERFGLDSDNLRRLIGPIT
ncbi:hypothetical protein [Bradyrhizobium sp. SZCCHNRI20481]|uniref:hypothetical protein n=1 Tax=Bradyrhizobium sp. SZCCHNRI20481 TaxID=3057286 RepID=UPI0029171259|nr:hypothetical protein [Bradyrhizobium sp. SZCCHNRI20481]